MQITHLIESNTLLTYALTTAPVPIQVSPATGPSSVATLTFVVSAPYETGAVVVQQIAFSLPIGDPAQPDAMNLTDDPTGITAGVSSSGSDKWLIGPGPTAGTFVLTPTAGSSGQIEAQGLAVVLGGIKVNRVVGTVNLTVAETARASGHQLEVREAIIGAAKFPYAFSAGNFSAEKPLVANGEGAVLSWSGSQQAVYRIDWSTHSQVVTNLRRWTSPPLADVTTFILQVTAQQGGQTVELRFSATVVVSNPSIVAQRLTVAGATKLSMLSVTNEVVARGRVSLFSGSQTIKAGGYQANSDGFVICRISGPQEPRPRRCWSLVEIRGAFGTCEITSGNCAVMGGGQFRADRAANCCLLPVLANTGFSLTEYNAQDNEVNARTEYTWVPLGSGSLTPLGLKKTAAHRPIKIKRPAPPPEPVAPDRTPDLEALVSTLARALKVEVSSADRARLKKAFLSVIAPAPRRAAKKPGRRK